MVPRPAASAQANPQSSTSNQRRQWHLLRVAILSWRRQWQPTPVLLPGKSPGRRSLVGCSPWGHEESDMTEWLHFHFSLSCIGEGNGIPLQCSCLESPRDGGAWWTAVSGVAQSRTWLKWLSSSSSNRETQAFLFHWHCKLKYSAFYRMSLNVDFSDVSSCCERG